MRQQIILQGRSPDDAILRRVERNAYQAYSPASRIWQTRGSGYARLSQLSAAVHRTQSVPWFVALSLWIAPAIILAQVDFARLANVVVRDLEHNAPQIALISALMLTYIITTALFLAHETQRLVVRSRMIRTLLRFAIVPAMFLSLSATGVVSFTFFLAAALWGYNTMF